jgi:hypothetical protein
MDQTADSQGLARRFNEDEAVWQRYEDKRSLRLRSAGGESVLPDEVQDTLDWTEAENECRLTWCVGRTIQKCRITP